MTVVSVFDLCGVCFGVGPRAPRALQPVALPQAPTCPLLTGHDLRFLGQCTYMLAKDCERCGQSVQAQWRTTGWQTVVQVSAVSTFGITNAGRVHLNKGAQPLSLPFLAPNGTLVFVDSVDVHVQASL